MPRQLPGVLLCAAGAGALCPRGWAHLRGAGSWGATRCFSATAEGHPWDSGQCPEGSALASFASMGEVALATSLAGAEGVWIGLRWPSADWGGSASWAWEDGAAFVPGLPGWEGGVPPPSRGACAVLLRTGLARGAGCSNKRPLLCLAAGGAPPALSISQISLRGKTMDYPGGLLDVGSAPFAISFTFHAADPGPVPTPVIGFDGVRRTVLVGLPARAAARGGGEWATLASKGFGGLSVVLRDATAAEPFPSLEFSVGSSSCLLPNVDWGRPHHWVVQRRTAPALLEVHEDGVLAAQCAERSGGEGNELPTGEPLRIGGPAQLDGLRGVVNGTVALFRVFREALSPQQAAVLAGEAFTLAGPGHCADAFGERIGGWRLQDIGDEAACRGICAAHPPCAAVTWLPLVVWCLMHATARPALTFSALQLVGGRGRLPVAYAVPGQGPSEANAQCWVNPHPSLGSRVDVPLPPADGGGTDGTGGGSGEVAWALAPPGLANCSAAGPGWARAASPDECGAAAAALFGLSEPPAVPLPPAAEWAAAECVLTAEGRFAMRAVPPTGGGAGGCGGGAACLCRVGALASLLVLAAAWSCPELGVGSGGPPSAALDDDPATAWRPPSCSDGVWLLLALPGAWDLRGFAVRHTGLRGLTVRACNVTGECTTAGACDVRAPAGEQVLSAACEFQPRAAPRWHLGLLGEDPALHELSVMVANNAERTPSPTAEAPLGAPKFELEQDEQRDSSGGSGAHTALAAAVGLGAGTLVVSACALLVWRSRRQAEKTRSAPPVLGTPGVSWVDAGDVLSDRGSGRGRQGSGEAGSRRLSHTLPAEDEAPTPPEPPPPPAPDLPLPPPPPQEHL